MRSQLIFTLLSALILTGLRSYFSSLLLRAFKGWSKNSGIVIITYQIDHFNLSPEKIMQHDKNPLPPALLGIICFFLSTFQSISATLIYHNIHVAIHLSNLLGKYIWLTLKCSNFSSFGYWAHATSNVSIIRWFDHLLREYGKTSCSKHVWGWVGVPNVC